MNRLLKLTFAAHLCAAAGPGFAETAELAQPEKALELYVVGAPMDKVLEQVMVSFAADSKIDGKVDQFVSSHRLDGTLDEILSQVETLYDIAHFKFNDVIYVSRAADIRTKILKIDGETPEEAVAALNKSGLPTDRFSLSTVARSDAVVVTAPDEFIKITEALLLAMKPQTRPSNGIVVRRGTSVSTEAVN